MTEEERLYAIVMKSLHDRWYPHPGQIPIIQAVFRDGVKFVFVRCGRKFGKSEVCCYLCWRYALSHPGSTVYYLGPEYKQTKEIIWANRRIQTFGPEDWIADESKQETRLTFLNNSFIKVDGSNNFEAYRGINPHFVVLDEFAQHDPRFIEVMWPNLASNNACIVIIGTPPAEYEDEVGNPHQYVQYQEDAEALMKDNQAFYIHAPSSANPHLPPGWLDKEKARLIRRGEEWLWRREYLAEYVRGGEHLIFPMFDRDTHVIPREAMEVILASQMDNLKFYLTADPGTTSTFGVLFVAINPYTQMVYVLDEIYERNPLYTSTRQIWQRCVKKIEAITGPNSQHLWTRMYDPAAAWFSNEMVDQFSVSFAPAEKLAGDRELGIGLMKDMFFGNAILISDLCFNYILEVSRYKTDALGRIQETNDHLIDPFRYFLRWINYKFKPKTDRELRPAVDRRRAYRLEEDLARAKRDKDWTQRVIDKY